MTNKFTSIGKDRNYSGPNCAYFIAGILEGFLRSSNLSAKVTPVIHQPDLDNSATEATEDRSNPYTNGGQNDANQPTIIYVIKFTADVFDRNANLNL